MEPFNRFYEENYKAVYRLAYRFLRNHDAAADISQDVFLYLYKRLEKGDKFENEKAWLYKVCSNLSLAHLKKNRRTIELNKKVEHNKVVEQTESEIYEALQRLNEKDRTLLILYNEGLSYEELSEASGIKFTSLGKRLSRTLKKLKNEMERGK